MAQWKETREPYVDVHEKVKTAAINPTAGENLIIGSVIISDAGPSTPTLISSQSEFLSTYASRDLTKDYIGSLNKLYKGDDNTMASTMWLNAYRLAGSGTMLVVRAAKAKDVFFAKPLVKDDNSVYILRDGQLLKKIPTFKLVVDIDKDDASHSSDGWSISINGVGVIGNRTTDDGAQYDYYVQNLSELVEYLNDTNLFFSPDYTYYADEKATVEATTESEAVSVVFNEVYVGANILDKTDTRTSAGLAYVVTCEKDWTPDNPTQKVIDLNDGAFSGFTATKYYATNANNSSSELKIRIRRFNHDAVISKELTENDAYEGGNSPYTVLTSVLDTFTKNGTVTPKSDVLYRDFYEVAVFDPAISNTAMYFNVGNILGRGDMELADLNASLSMIQVNLPDNLTDLGLDYYGYVPSTKKEGWAKVEYSSLSSAEVKKAVAYDSKAAMNAVTGSTGDVAVIGKESVTYYKYTGDSWVAETATHTTADAKYVESSLANLKAHIAKPAEGDIAAVGKDVEGSYYKWQKGLTADNLDPEEIYADLSIDPEKYALLNVSDNDIMSAYDQIGLDEIYQTEGLTDNGCTSPMVQSYVANMAINENYFYPFSTVNSTNYLAIANSINRLSQDSYKLYASAPWDTDTSTVGFKFYAAPSTLYWEAVNRNRGLDREFAPLLGQINGRVLYQKPVVEFNKKTRQLLLSKKINTVKWDTQITNWEMNDNYTKQTEDTIMSDEANSRLMIRISKSMPNLLRQFVGRRIGDILYSDMYSVIDYWFKTTILPMTYTISAYRITIADINNDELARQNKVRVLVEVRYARAAKYIEVYNYAYDVGMAFEGQV